MKRHVIVWLGLLLGATAPAQEPATAPAHAVPAWYLGVPVIMNGRPPPAARDREQMPRTTVYVHAPVSPTAGAAPMKTIPHPDKGEVALPPHQNTLSEMLSAADPRLAIGYFVEIGPAGSEDTVKTQPQPEKSWPSRPLAEAIRIGTEWVPVNSQAVIEYGLARGLLQLEFFDVGGLTWGSWFEPAGETLGEVRLTIGSQAALPAIDWDSLLEHRPGDPPR